MNFSGKEGTKTQTSCTENLFNAVITGNFPSLETDIDAQVWEAFGAPAGTTRKEPLMSH